MPFLPCSPAPSSAYRVLLPCWILLVMSFLPSASLISPMCLVDCTSSISCLPSGHVCVFLFLPPLTMTTSLFVELMIEDEIHVLNTCSAYQPFRESFLQKINNLGSYDQLSSSNLYLALNNRRHIIPEK